MDDLELGATIRGFSAGQKVFNRYLLQKILGRGGMGVVWLARDEELEREVALKFLPEVVAMDRQAIQDLKRETRRSLELTHPHIIRIYDFVQDGRTAAISMEYISGDTLASLKLDQPQQVFAAADLAKWVRQLCEALEYAHAKAQVVHRDLKPANLMIDSRGDLKIADFGIAASVSDSVSRVSNQTGSSGTPVYMSPQQMMGDKPAVSDDIYSLGATLYDLLSGKPPFFSGNIIAQVQSKVPPPLSQRLRENGVERPVPAEWEQTIAACLAKEADGRPKSAREVAHRLGILGTTTAAPFVATPAPVPAPAALTTPAKQETTPASKKAGLSLVAGVAAAVLLLAGGMGWYYGFHLPEQRRVQEEQVRLAQERELAAAIKEVETHLAATDWVKAEVALAALERTGAGKPAGWSGQWASAANKLQSDLKQRREQARLAALRVPVTVRTNPPGAEVVLDGTPRGLSPLAGLPLPLGRHSIVARLANHDELEQTIEVTEKGQGDWTFALVRSTGRLAFQVRPAGAEYALYAVDDNGRRLTSAPRYSGTAGGEPLAVETGRYEVLVTPRTKVAGLEHRETLSVRRGETATVAADVRTGTLQVSTNPAGAEVWQDGRRVGVTPLTLENLPPRKSVEIELRLSGYKTAKESILIPNADVPQDWQATLEEIPRFTLRPRFSEGPASVRVNSELRNTSTVTVEVKGQRTTNPVSTSFASSSVEYRMSETDRAGEWERARARFSRHVIDGKNYYQPGSIVDYTKVGSHWEGRFSSGGHDPSYPVSQQFQPMTYPGAWLSAAVMPDGPVVVGRAWEVPISSAGMILAIPRLTNATGEIRGKIVGADLKAATPWAEVEYTFNVSGDHQQYVISGITYDVSMRDMTGTLRIRLLLAEKYAARANSDFRVQYIFKPKGRMMTESTVAFTINTPDAPTLYIDSTIVGETMVEPLGGGSFSSSAQLDATPAKVPVYFSRKNNVMLGIAARLGADLNGSPLVRLSDGTYQMVEMTPGTYPIQIVQGVGESMGVRVDTILQVVPGQTNYFEIFFGMTKPQMRALSETEGRSMVAGLKPTRLMGSSSPTPAQPAVANRKGLAVQEARRQAVQAVQAAGSQPYSVGEVELPPVLRVGGAPEYPYEMRRAGISGSVQVQFIVDVNGDVVQATVVQSSHKAFEQNAVESVLKWKFRPALKDGRAVNVQVIQKIDFNLQQ